MPYCATAARGAAAPGRDRRGRAPGAPPAPRFAESPAARRAVSGADVGDPLPVVAREAEGADAGMRRDLAVGEAHDGERLNAGGIDGVRAGAALRASGAPLALKRLDLGLVGLGDDEREATVGRERRGSAGAAEAPPPRPPPPGGPACGGRSPPGTLFGRPM